MGLADDIKRVVWEELEEVMQSVPQRQIFFLGGDFNGHIGNQADGYDMMHRGFGLGKFRLCCNFGFDYC